MANGIIITNTDTIDVAITPSNNATIIGKRSGNVVHIHIQSGGNAIPQGVWTTIGTITDNSKPKFDVGVFAPNTAVASWGFIRITSTGYIQVYQVNLASMVISLCDICYIV